MILRRTSSVPKEDVFPDCCTVIRCAPRLVAGAPRLVAGAPRLVAGAPRLVDGAPGCSQVLPKFSLALRGVPKPVTITPVPVIRDPSYSEGRQECPPMV